MIDCESRAFRDESYAKGSSFLKLMKLKGNNKRVGKKTVMIKTQCHSAVNDDLHLIMNSFALTVLSCFLII